MSTLLSRQIAAYEDMRAELEADHFGKWVVIHNEKLAGVYEDFESAAASAVQQFGRGPYNIRQVGDEGPVKLPATVMWGV